MIKQISRPIACVAAILLWTGAAAQHSANASGGDASGSGGSVAYSVGQVTYTTIYDTTGSVAQGVQYAYDIINIGVNEIGLGLSISVFPNPTADFLVLQVKELHDEKLSYQLYDADGRLLKNGPLTGKQEQLSMAGLPTAMYFIYVLDQANNKVQTFKIIKQ